jgi:hypothetical protein
MSKILLAPAAMVLAVIMAACGGSPPADNSTAEPAAPADTMAPADNTMAPAEPAAPAADPAAPAADPAAPATGG